MSLVLFIHNLNDVLIQLWEMASHKEKKNLAKENKLLLMELPYYNCKDLKNAHPPCNALLDTNLASRKSIHSFNSLYDLGLFQNDSVYRFKKRLILMLTWLT